MPPTTMLAEQKTESVSALPGGGVRLTSSPWMKPATAPKPLGQQVQGEAKDRTASDKSNGSDASSQRGGVRLDPEIPEFKPSKHAASSSIATSAPTTGSSSTTGLFQLDGIDDHDVSVTPGNTQFLGSDKSTPKVLQTAHTPTATENASQGSSTTSSVKPQNAQAHVDPVLQPIVNLAPHGAPQLPPLPFRIQQAQQMAYHAQSVPTPPPMMQFVDARNINPNGANILPMYIDNRGATQSAVLYRGGHGEAQYPDSGAFGTRAQSTPAMASAQPLALIQHPGPQLYHLPPAGAHQLMINPHVGVQHPSVMGTSILAQIEGNAGVAVKKARSDKLNALTSSNGGHPTIETVMSPEYFPFHLGVDKCNPQNFGVAKIKNIPFKTTRAELVAFIGRNSKMLGDREEGIHIIVDRASGKTLDAYVEFNSMRDASNIVNKHAQVLINGRYSKIGDRPVEVELSSQSALMKEIFPFARGIIWNGAVPELQRPTPNQPWTVFKGFITEEQMTQLVKANEAPPKSPNALLSPQRPFEAMISVIRKFPWYMPGMITLGQRHTIFRTVKAMIELLQEAIVNDRHRDLLTEQLLRRLCTAVMISPGFTVAMKDDVCYMMKMPAYQQRDFCQPLEAQSWRHVYVTLPKPGYPLDLIEWYIAMIREETIRKASHLPLPVRMQLEEQAKRTDGYWGYFWAEVDLPRGAAFDNYTLRQAGDVELACIESILKTAVSGAVPQT